MTSFRKVSIASLLALALACSGVALAQDHHDDQRDEHHDDHHDNGHYMRHKEWHKGARINDDDWNRGDRVDYRQAHLHAPPDGYEWRRVDGNYVMAAVATGVIASVIIASAAH
jgi:Ni/Co efflux regulator RcnB